MEHAGGTLKPTAELLSEQAMQSECWLVSPSPPEDLGPGENLAVTQSTKYFHVGKRREHAAYLAEAESRIGAALADTKSLAKMQLLLEGKKKPQAEETEEEKASRAAAANAKMRSTVGSTQQQHRQSQHIQRTSRLTLAWRRAATFLAAYAPAAKFLYTMAPLLAEELKRLVTGFGSLLGVVEAVAHWDVSNPAFQQVVSPGIDMISDLPSLVEDGENGILSRTLGHPQTATGTMLRAHDMLGAHSASRSGTSRGDDYTIGWRSTQPEATGEWLPGSDLSTARPNFIWRPSTRRCVEEAIQKVVASGNGLAKAAWTGLYRVPRWPSLSPLLWTDHSEGVP